MRKCNPCSSLLILLFIYTPLRQQNWSSSMTPFVTSGIDTWTEVEISYVPLLDLCSLLTDELPTALLDCEWLQVEPRVWAKLSLTFINRSATALAHRESNKCYLNKRKILERPEVLLPNMAFFCRLVSRPRPFILFCFHKDLLTQSLGLTLGCTSIYNKHLMNKVPHPQ